MTKMMMNESTLINVIRLEAGNIWSWRQWSLSRQLVDDSPIQLFMFYYLISMCMSLNHKIGLLHVV
jgi:hypothetical protein